MSQPTVNDVLPYDVLIDPSGFWYGPAGTLPKSRDWVRWQGTIDEIFAIMLREDFVLSVDTWLVCGYVAVR